jgi:DNA-binding Xre family transcriptional regulator
MGRASRRAVRFTTLTAICDVLDCSPGELLSLRDKSTAHLRSKAET